MRQRIMIAMALLCRPKLLIADEPTTALDVTVQAQMLELFTSLTAEFGTALIMITHDLGVVAGLADRMMVMYAGRAVGEGNGRRAVLRSAPSLYAGAADLDAACRGAAARRLNPITGLAAQYRASAARLHVPSALRASASSAALPRCRCCASSSTGRAKACHYEGKLVFEEENVA